MICKFKEFNFGRGIEIIAENIAEQEFLSSVVHASFERNTEESPFHFRLRRN